MNSTLAELAALRERMDALENRVETRLEEERSERREDIRLLRETASATVAGAAATIDVRLAAIASEQSHQSSQLKLIGQAMELLLAAEDLEMPHG